MAKPSHCAYLAAKRSAGVGFGSDSVAVGTIVPILKQSLL
jgi:uncharacterized Ntn-hydrolase superfamily protein